MRRIGESDIGTGRSYNPKNLSRHDGYDDYSHGLPGPSKSEGTGGFGQTRRPVDITAVTARCCTRAGGLPHLGEPSRRIREDFNGA